MASTITCLSSPPFPSKTHEFFSLAVSKPNPHDPCGYLTVGSRRNSFTVSKTSHSSSLRLAPPTVRAEADSYVKKETMLPPYNVLITGSTKGFSFTS